MSDKADDTEQAEALRDENEFYMRKSSRERNSGSDRLPTSKDSSRGASTDGLHFKSESHYDTDTHDRLSLLFQEGAERQAKEIEEKLGKRRISDTVEYDNDTPPPSKNFFGRLVSILTRPKTPEADCLDDEIFTEIDESEIKSDTEIDKSEIRTTADDDNTEIDKSEIGTTTDDNTEIDKDKSPGHHALMHNFRLFMDEVNEETNVIRGLVDEDEFLNRQCRKAKTSISSINSDQMATF